MQDQEKEEPGLGRALKPGNFPQLCPPGWLLPRAGHSLRYVGTDEVHSNSETRRTTNFMGIVRSTPPYVGNVLGPPGRLPQAETGRRRRPTLLPQGRGRQATVASSAQAQKRWMKGSRTAVAPPALSAAQRGGVTAPRPSLVHMLAKASRASESLDTPGNTGALRVGVWWRQPMRETGLVAVPKTRPLLRRKCLMEVIDK